MYWYQKEPGELLTDHWHGVVTRGVAWRCCVRGSGGVPGVMGSGTDVVQVHHHRGTGPGTPPTTTVGQQWPEPSTVGQNPENSVKFMKFQEKYPKIQ